MYDITMHGSSDIKPQRVEIIFTYALCYKGMIKLAWSEIMEGRFFFEANRKNCIQITAVTQMVVMMV